MHALRLIRDDIAHEADYRREASVWPEWAIGMEPDRFERGFARQLETPVFQKLLDERLARFDRLPPVAVAASELLDGSPAGPAPLRSWAGAPA